VTINPDNTLARAPKRDPRAPINPDHEIRPDQVRYSSDGLITRNNCDFVYEERFQRAYARAVESSHKLDSSIQWRVRVCIWAAQQGASLEGDFVECGCYTGTYSSAIADYLDFGAMTDRKLYLFDTFNGIALDLLSEEEQRKAAGFASKNERYYKDFYEVTRRNFEHLPNVELIKGRVPDSLAKVPIDKVAYLSIDMNSVTPEVEAVRYFWPKLTQGAVVVLDDYGFDGHQFQRLGMDALGREIGFEVLGLPTGQGLILKGGQRPPV